MFNISDYVRSGFPLLFVETFEIKRAVKSITVDEEINRFNWNLIDGLINVEPNLTNPMELIERISSIVPEKSLVVVENFEQFLESIELVQMILNKMILLKNKQITICIVGTEVKFPGPLDKMITVLEFNLPSKEDFRKTVKDFAEQVEVEYDESVADACIGLSLEEGENAVALQLVREHRLDKTSVLETKRSMIKKTGFMDFIEPELMSNVGGLENLKQYILARKTAWELGNEDKPKLKAMLLVGLSGCGKSLVAKAIASIFEVPLIQLDIGAMKAGIVGETEKKTRIATKTIDATGSCLVMADEIEKSFAGTGSGAYVGDSGVSKGQLGHFLTWMQERKSEAIIVATANDISALPPEMLRAERFDVIWFVDFPNFEERKEIVEIMNRKWKSNLPTDDDFIELLEHWTGAEIGQLAKDSHFESIETCMANIPILYKFRKKEMEAIQEFGKTVRKANGVSTRQNGRKGLGLKRIVSTKKDTNSNFDEEIDTLKKNIGRKHFAKG
jgi:SpoVK/Ycf46/Vps4 family AAA+-type ATPase